MDKKYVSNKEALQKAKHYCAYQERCHKEVKEKLYGFGLNTDQVSAMISTLIEENYINEERFAIMYAGGHFRTKNWGRVKINYELSKKQVSKYCIKSALAEIPETDYLQTLHQLAVTKLKSLEAEKNIFSKRRKLMDHLRMKGFETDLSIVVINELVK